MKITPLLSIITVNLNNRAGLERTIQSVINQSFTDYEFLILDGGSVDGSKAVIDTFANAIHYWISESDRGIYHAMNKGIERATGLYCLFLNSGDLLVDKHALEQCFEKEQTADLVIGSCHVSKDGRIIHTSRPTDELTLQSFYGTTIPHQSTFIKRTLFDKLGPYNEAYTIHGDYDFWIRSVIVHHCSVAVINHVIADYNLEGISNSPAYQEQSRQEIHQILRQAFPERVLADYEFWKLKTAELNVWEWVKTQKLLYQTIHFMYKQAVALVSFKRRLTPSKSDK